MSRSRFLTAVILLATSTIALAKPPFWKTFVDTYKIKPDSVLGKSKCLSCHLPPAPPKRNAYGLAVQAAMEAAHSRSLTPEILKSIDLKDSDGDGYTNIAEIQAGTLPGDKKSKPKKTQKGSKTSRRETPLSWVLCATLIPLAVANRIIRSSRS